MAEEVEQLRKERAELVEACQLLDQELESAGRGEEDTSSSSSEVARLEQVLQDRLKQSRDNMHAMELKRKQV